MFPRLLLAWAGLALCSFTLTIVSYFNKKGAPYTGIKSDIIRFTTMCAARNIITCMSCWSIEVEERKVDYSKYLGPDWKCSFKNATAVVSNHLSWIDTMAHMYR